MITLLKLKIISILIILLISLIGGAYPFIKRHQKKSAGDFPIAEALAAGIFLGVGLIHMLGDASQGFAAQHIHYPMPFLLAGSTFLLLLWLEHLSRELYHHKGHSNTVFAILATVILSIHSFLAGAALGLSSTYSIVIVVLVAILAHKWAASFALAIQINKSTLKIGTRMALFIVFAIMTPLGILMGQQAGEHLQQCPLIEPIFTSLAAGTFLYLGTLHGLKQAVMVNKCCNLKHFSFVILGFAIMALVALYS